MYAEKLAAQPAVMHGQLALGSRLKLYRRELRNLGLRNWISWKKARLRSTSLSRGTMLKLSAPGVDVYCRAKTSDTFVFGQIFGLREYRCLDQVSDAKLIIDCGANVGYSAAYFLTRYPNAHLIAVEPDADNFRMAQRNLEPFGSRARMVRAGVWSKSVGLVMGEEQFGVGKEWAFTVREAKAGEEPTLQAVGIDSLLETSGFDRISILKIDIEGAETEVFKNAPWLDKVDHLVIETHGPDCEQAVLAAVNGRAKATHCEELTVFDFVE